MWTYKISTGRMSENSTPRPEVCYSGHGPFKNDPDKCSVPYEGPVPPNKYKFDKPFDSPDHGPFCLRLTPLPGSTMFGRDGFLIHGDSKEHPGAASQGCIIAPRLLREAMNASQDRILEVIP